MQLFKPLVTRIFHLNSRLLRNLEGIKSGISSFGPSSVDSTIHWIGVYQLNSTVEPLNIWDLKYCFIIAFSLSDFRIVSEIVIQHLSILFDFNLLCLS